MSTREQFDLKERIIGIDFLNVHYAFSSLLTEVSNLMRHTPSINEDAEESAAGILIMLLDTGHGNVKTGIGTGTISSSLESQKDLIVPQVSDLFVKHFQETYEIALPSFAELPVNWRATATGIRLLSRYEFLPPSPNAHELEFGVKTVGRDSNNTETFCRLMDLLEDSPEPLDNGDVFYLVNAVKQSPGILHETSPNDKLSTLLSHAVSGTQKDKRLLEFLIQMGGNDKITVNGYSLYRGVHLCAENGNLEAIKTLLSYYDYVDIDVLSPDNESPLYIAVKNMHKDVYRYLLQKYARPDVGKNIMGILERTITNSSDRADFRRLLDDGKPYQQPITDVVFDIKERTSNEKAAMALQNDLQTLAAPRHKRKQKAIAITNMSTEEMAAAEKKADEAMAALLLEEEIDTASNKKHGSGAPRKKEGAKKKKGKKQK